MADEDAKQKERPKFMKIGNASKPITLHPLTTEAAVAALLKVKPLVKPEK